MSHFQSNKANRAGGVIFTLLGNISASSTSFTNNSAMTGGVIYSHDVLLGFLRFKNVLFENNLAENGGMINTIGCFVAISDTTFINNRQTMMEE